MMVCDPCTHVCDSLLSAAQIFTHLGLDTVIKKVYDLQINHTQKFSCMCNP